jgi:sugar-phosphatase
MQLSYDAVSFDLFGTLVTEDGHACPGAAEALRALPPDRWAVVTSCSGGFAQALLASAGLPAPLILVSGDVVKRNKPAPDGYLRAAALLGAPAARVLVVEDSAHGIAAGRSAGMDVIAVLRGRSSEAAFGASYLVDRLTEISWQVTSEGRILVTF